MRRYACVTGRFQPVHDQHLQLIEMALTRADRVIVAITNPDSDSRRAEATSAHRHTPQANPFSYFERSLLLQAALCARGWGSKVLIVPFDLTRPECWSQYVPMDALQIVRVYSDWEKEKCRQLEDAGYAVWQVQGEPALKMHSTSIRAAMSADQDWTKLVPSPTVSLLQGMLDARKGQVQ